jgi:glycosyltransferase involved in cell wall biosynthesis
MAEGGRAEQGGSAATGRPPRVSVICNFYDAADYLAEAIESVLAQDEQDFELILVDDGSTDPSSDIARDYARSRPEQVRSVQFPARANRGRSAARNLGLQHARGEFVAFIDADDRWRPNKLREQLELLTAMPHVDAVCGAVNYWRSWNGGSDERVSTGHVEDCLVSPPNALLYWYPLGKAHAPSISDLLMRAAKVRAAGGFEDQFTGAFDDQAFLTKFYLRSAIYVSSRVWSDYRLHDASCMATLVREGGYHGARSKFLHWFERYLTDDPEFRNPDIIAALRRALLPYRCPPLGPPIRLAGKILRRFSRA